MDVAESFAGQVVSYLGDLEPTAQLRTAFEETEPGHVDVTTTETATSQSASMANNNPLLQLHNRKDAIHTQKALHSSRCRVGAARIRSHTDTLQ